MGAPHGLAIISMASLHDIKGHIGALLVVPVWGSTFVSSKVLLNVGLEPAELFLIRFIMAYVCICILCHGKLFADNLKDELTLMGLGVMGGSLYFLLENIALMYSTSANVCILVCSTPLVTAILLSFFYKSERLSLSQTLGSLMAFVGMSLVVLNGQLFLHLNPIGDALAFGASVSWAFYSLFMRRIMSRYHTDFITRKVFAYGLLTIIPYFIFVKPMNVSVEQLSSPVVILNLLFLGLVASTGAYLLWNWVMKQLGAVKSSNYIYLQPLVTIVLAYYVLGERITWMAMAGAVILIAGMMAALKKS